MADNKGNIVVIGPDLISGVGPDGDLPKPGPDKSNFQPEESAPGHLLGSVRNVYYFDDAISKLLGGEGDDWRRLTIDLEQEQFDCEFGLGGVTIKKGTHLYIHHPEANNIPNNVFIVLSNRLKKSIVAPDAPDQDDYHWHFSVDDPNRGEWYISPELKERLEKLYNWTFFENVNVGADWGTPIVNDDGELNGGVEITASDIQYHDLHLAIDSTVPLSGSPDTRANDNQFDWVVLVGYSPAIDPSIPNLTAEIVSGDCVDKDFIVRVSWDEITFSDGLIGVSSYRIYRKVDQQEPELIGTTDGNTFFFADSSIKEDVENGIVDCGVTGSPAYYVQWISTDGDASELNLANATGILVNGIPCCTPGGITLKNPEVGECWKPKYGTVKLDWNIDVLKGTSPQTIVVNRIFPLMPDLNKTVTLDKTYAQFYMGYIDDGLNILPGCDPALTYEVTYEVILNSLDDTSGEEMTTMDTVTVTIECCDCEDLEDNPFAEDGEGEGEGTNYCDNCWMDEGAELRLWMEGYFEDPLSGNASFDIRYCISNPCILGMHYADIYLDLPEGTIITSVEPNEKAIGSIHTASFALGSTPGRWKIVVDQLGTSGEIDGTPEIEALYDENKDNLLAPLSGILATVYIDTPLNLNRACLDTGEILNALDDGSQPQDSSEYESVLSCVIKKADGSNAVRNYYQHNNIKSDRYTEADVDEFSHYYWQTGPCLSTCTDEVNMGYGDYYLNVRAVDNDTFDVDYCLVREDFDTFVLVCLMTDFQTMVNAIDDTFGDIVDRGWKVGYRNISPGFTIIYGHGKNPIPSSGLSTLARVHLTNPMIQNPSYGVGDISDAETCVCVFPLFMNLGDLFDTLESYIVSAGSDSVKNIMDSERVAGKVSTEYTSPVGYTNYSEWFNQNQTNFQFFSYVFANAPDFGDMGQVDPSAFQADQAEQGYNFGQAATQQYFEYQSGSGFWEDMQNIAIYSDPRFSEMIVCLSDAYERVISNYSNTPEYSQIGGIRESAISTVHYFRIFFMIWTSLVRSIPNMQKKLNNTTERLEQLCPNQLAIRPVRKISGSTGTIDLPDGQLAFEVLYKFPMCAVSGVEIDFSEFADELLQNARTFSLDNSYSFTGDADSNYYLQAYSDSTKKYLCTYGAGTASSKPENGNSDNGYLKSKSISESTEGEFLDYQVLTRFIVGANGDEITPDENGNEIEKIYYWIENYTSSSDDDDGDGVPNSIDPDWNDFYDLIRETDLIKASDLSLESAKVVSNEKLVKPTQDWTGSSYRVGDASTVDAKDFIATLMLAIYPDENTEDSLSESVIEETIFLPSSSSAGSVKQFFNLDSIDLTGVSYDPTGATPWIDSVGDYILPTVDADGDGQVGIKDVVSIRNLWVIGGYPYNVSSQVRYNVVPTECCVSFDIDAEIYVPDECSNFCVRVGCFSKLWFSDLIVINDANDNPDKYLLEVSYAINCMERESRPVEEISGVQFKVQGLGGIGIDSTQNGQGENNQADATAVQSAMWDEYIIPSESTTKDTYFAYSTNGQYIPTGKGVLCYLVVSPDSMPSEESYIEQKLNDEFITINKFKKYDKSPMLDLVNLASDVKVYYPLANLRFKSHHTDELLIYERFGLRISNFKITANTAVNYYELNDQENDVSYVTNKTDVFITSEPHENWTGLYEEDGDITTTNLDYVMQLAAKNQYDINFDSDGSGKIDIVDIQTIAHSIYDEDFEMGDSIVPSICCPCDEPAAPNLLLLDHNSSEITVPVVSSRMYGRMREVTLTPDQFGCDASKKHKGGVLLYWAPVDCDYYIVYRKSPDEAPVAIIGTAPGVRRSTIDFNARTTGSNRKPIQITPTMWIDYPPARVNECCDPCDDLFDGEGEGEGVDCVQETVEEFEYWVVAINKCNEVESNKEIGGIPCCRFKPIAQDFTIVAMAGEEHRNNFKIFHQQAIRPYGFAENRRDALGLWSWVQNSSQGNGHSGLSENGGNIKTESKRPDSRGFGGVNQSMFTYTPPDNFIGKDSFTYSVSVFDEELREKPHLWCKDTGVVTVYVVPPSPKAKGKAGICSDSETRGLAVIQWRPVFGVTSYNVYRGSELVASIENDGSALYKFEEVPPGWVDWNDGTGEGEGGEGESSDIFNVQYSVSSVYSVDEVTAESLPWTVNFDMPYCPPVINPDISVEAFEFCDDTGSVVTKGYVEIEWEDLGDIDAYNIYRKGPYRESENKSILEFEMVGQITTAIEPDPITGFHMFTDNGVEGCEGCGSLYYDYYVTSATVSGEGDEQNIKTVQIDCCNVAPVAYDQEFTVDYDKSLWQKKLKAMDLDADIVRYEINSFPDEDQGIIYNFDEVTGYFTFDALPLFQGEIKIPWTVYDSCGEQASATLTINVRPPEECSEKDFTICNASLKWLTEQQDVDDIRLKSDDLDQVPFILNTKGVPSLRKRCGAYNVTRGIDPSIFARANDGCKFPEEFEPEPSGPFELIVNSISLEACLQSFMFTSCKPLTLGSIEPSFECQAEIMFSECKPLSFNTSVEFSCEETSAFSDGCKLIDTIANINFICDEAYVFNNGCGVATNESGSFFMCGEDITFGSSCSDGGVIQTGSGDALIDCGDSLGLILGCGINYENYLIDVIPCFDEGEGEGEGSGEG